MTAQEHATPTVWLVSPTLGAYTRDAIGIARVRHDLRLITGNDLVDLIFEHYERFDVKYKALLPLRSVYVVERVDHA